MGAKIVCLEEASRLDQAVFQEVIVPLLGVKDTCVLGISTPLDDTNFYSQMTEMKQEDGKTPLFNVITISLICEECAGKDLQGQITCPHKQNEIPPWKTQRRQDLVKKLLESNPEMYKREQLGVITGSANCAFPAHRITQFEGSCEECAEVRAPHRWTCLFGRVCARINTRTRMLGPARRASRLSSAASTQLVAGPGKPRSWQWIV